jgi:hypothetical protein
MVWLSRSLCALGLLALLLLGASAWPAGFRALGMDLRTFTEDLPRIQRGSERSDELDAVRHDTLRRLQAKERLTLELIKGKVTLLEAARRFRELAPVPADVWHEIVAREKGATEGERLCRWVIEYARGVATDQAIDPRPVVARLEAELAAQLARHGNDALPKETVPTVPAAAPPSSQGQR